MRARHPRPHFTPKEVEELGSPIRADEVARETELPFLERASNRLGLGFLGERGDFRGETLDPEVLDVQSHVP